ncbi:HNH endonuclease [Cyanophage S-RIM50]|uniref:Putative endonuclease n=1 Tax=Cyanophage S-RIM50 TaxID=687803 RepID=A0A127KL47_9CAUD|nr:HNH endonuclease [Cyanophage S-RIM50]AMO42802.1 putative endonuclease [Cyanophage S-RIM50]
MPHADKEDLKRYQASYKKEYQKRPEVKEKRKALREQRVQRNKEFVLEHMTPCIECGEADPVVIDFHHLDATEKEDGVSRLIWNNSSLDKIKTEIDKCVCLCSNCHRRVHAGTVQLRM